MKNNALLKVLLTLIITASVLFLTSSVHVSYYLNATHVKKIEAEEIITFFGKNTYFLLQLLPVTAGLISLLCCIRFIHKESVKSYFTQRIRFDVKRVALAFGIWIIYLSSVFVFECNFSGSSIIWNPNFKLSQFVILFSISLIFLGFQTLFEELLFRSYVQQKFIASGITPFISILISACLFGLVHMGNPEIHLLGKYVLLYFIGAGTCFGLQAFLDKGLELSFGLHYANNLFFALILTNNWQIFQTDALFIMQTKPSFHGMNWISLFLVFPMLLLIYGKLYKWKWHELLATFDKKTHD